MTNPLELLKTNAISAVNLLAVLDASASDAEKLEEIFDFIGATAEHATHLNTGDDEYIDVPALQEALDEARRAVVDREAALTEQFEGQAQRAATAEQENKALQKELSKTRQAVTNREIKLQEAELRAQQLKQEIKDHDDAHAKRIAEFEKQLESMNEHSAILTEVAVAHKRIAESMRKNENGDYEGAAKKLMTAEKILQKITGKEYHYD